MAAPNKRRVASPREPSPRPIKPNSNGTTKGVPTADVLVGHQMFGAYRTLKILQIMMEGVEKFLDQFSPFLPDEAGHQAAKLNAEIKTNMPIVNAHISRMEGVPTAEPGPTARKDGAA